MKPILLLVCLVLPVSMAVSASNPPPPCTDMVEIMGVGLACPKDGGLFEIYDSEGQSLGHTHGPDPIPVDAEETVFSLGGLESSAAESLDSLDILKVISLPSSIRCIEDADVNYKIQVIYARAFDDLETVSKPPADGSA